MNNTKLSCVCILDVHVSVILRHLIQFQLSEESIIKALSMKLVGQCALMTLGQLQSKVKDIQEAKSSVNFPLLTGIQVVGDGCETILSYPPFSHHALTPPTMSSKQVANHPASLLSFSSPSSQGAVTPLHCQSDTISAHPFHSLSPWDSVQHGSTTPLPSHCLSPWDSVQHGSTTPLPSHCLSPWDSVQHGSTTPLPSHCLSPWDSVQHGSTTPLPSHCLSPWDSVQHGSTTPLPSHCLSPWDHVQYDSTARSTPVHTYRQSPLGSEKHAILETPELFADPNRDATDSSVYGSPELFLKAATPVISRGKCLPKMMLADLDALDNSLTPDIL